MSEKKGVGRVHATFGHCSTLKFPFVQQSLYCSNRSGWAPAWSKTKTKINESSKNYDEEEDDNCSEESIMNDSELYTGFDEDGNRIVEDDYDEK